MKDERKFELQYNKIDDTEYAIEEIKSFFDYEDLSDDLSTICNAQEVSVYDSLTDKTIDVTCIETKDYYYVADIDAGIGWGQYPKGSYSEREAIIDQAFEMWED